MFDFLEEVCDNLDEVKEILQEKSGTKKKFFLCKGCG